MFNLFSGQMYKVFFNEHLLVQGDQINNSPKDNICETADIKDFKDLETHLQTLERSKHVVKLLIVLNEGLDLMQLLADNMTLIPAAGGLVTNASGRFLCIRRFGRWDLPKGKIEAGEEPDKAAIREVEEECGISGMSISEQLPSTFHIYRSPYLPADNNWVLKETHWFKMNYAGEEHLKPQTEEQIEEVRWVSENELPMVYRDTYGNLKELLKPYLL